MARGKRWTASERIAKYASEIDQHATRKPVTKEQQQTIHYLTYQLSKVAAEIAKAERENAR